MTALRGMLCLFVLVQCYGHDMLSMVGVGQTKDVAPPTGSPVHGIDQSDIDIGEEPVCDTADTMLTAAILHPDRLHHSHERGTRPQHGNVNWREALGCLRSR